MKQIITAILMLPLLVSCQAQQMAKPEYEVSYVPRDKLVALAIATLEKAGLGPKYNVIKPFYVQTPSPMGEDFVGFTMGQPKPDGEGFVRLQCIVLVNSLRGTAGQPEELRNGARQVFVHLDKIGNVTGSKTMEPQPTAGDQKDISIALIGKWEYISELSRRRLSPADGVWNYLRFRKDGKVDWAYDYDGKTYKGTDFYDIQYSGKIDKYRRKYPIIYMKPVEPMGTRVTTLIGVTIDYDCRVPAQEGKVLKFTDPDGYESIFIQRHLIKTD